MSLQDLRYVTTFLKELLGLATAQRPLLIFFDSIDELTGSQVCDNLSKEATRSCHCSGKTEEHAQRPHFLYALTQ